MKRLIEWTPDTCDCVFHVEWDTDESENARVHVPKKGVKTCQAHSADIGLNFRHAKVVEECQRKNYFLEHLREGVSSAVENVERSDGQVIKQLKKGKEYKWHFNNERKLIVDLKGFTASEKNEAAVIANNKFGDKIQIL